LITVSEAKRGEVSRQSRRSEVEKRIPAKARLAGDARLQSQHEPVMEIKQAVVKLPPRKKLAPARWLQAQLDARSGEMRT